MTTGRSHHSHHASRTVDVEAIEAALNLIRRLTAQDLIALHKYHRQVSRSRTSEGTVIFTQSPVIRLTPIEQITKCLMGNNKKEIKK